MIRRGEILRAEQLLESHVMHRPSDASAHRLLGVIALQARRMEAAAAHLQRASELLPRNPVLRCELGKVLAQTGQMEQALRCFEQAAEAAPDEVEPWLLIGVTAGRMGRTRDAVHALRKAHSLSPSQPMVQRELAERLFEAGDAPGSLPLWTHIAKADPSDVHARLRLGETLSRLGMHRDAVSNYRDAVSTSPDVADLWLALGQALEDDGDRDGARRAYQTALDLKTDWALPLSALLGLGQGDGSSQLVAQAQRLQAGAALGDADRALIGYELGKVLDSLGDHAAAFASWADANRARRRTAGPMDREALEQWVADALASSPAEAEGPDFAAGEDESLVFIVGMPRSGTTLTEQIIAAHPLAIGCGELPDMALIAQRADAAGKPPYPSGLLREWADSYMSSVRRHAEGTAKTRFVDKAPLNFFHLPLIASMFPRARVIWMRRDPRDIALSIYSQNFSPDARFATDLCDLGHYINAHVRLMRHWTKTLPISLLEMDYHSLAQEPETQARKLLEFIGLDWDERCLDFHRSKRGVQTPSRWQVKEPVHTRSLGRWHRHEGSLQPLIEVLSPSAYV
ncbi:MAG: sulfotransferase [Lysobacter spongiicola]|nr:sulfotransferase [Lysobacter spongiicola]